jgi:predicted metal-dependent HD superfamily phosphohydrolase/uncharacterized protein with PIN domain
VHPTSFACDAMLGGLARWLRAAGYDASWHEGIEDRDLVRLSRDEGRTLLSCDTKIFDFAVIRDGLQASLLVPRHLRPREQLRHVLEKLSLPLLEPRCMACGGELAELAKEQIAGRVPARTYAWLDRFWECSRCRKALWQGTHWAKIQAALTAAQEHQGSTGSTMDVEMLERWMNLTGTWCIEPTLASRAFEDIRSQYAESARHYHTLKHIREVLAVIDRLAAHATSPNAVRLAAWLHDIIYDSRASNNEERSAQYARRLCEQLGIPDGASIADLIQKTKTHRAGDDANAQVLLDADLAVLGASPDVYQAYARNIRLEYGWVPDAEYRTGRRRVLESFLSRPRIYHLLTKWEEPARHNIAAEIADLAGVEE